MNGFARAVASGLLVFSLVGCGNQTASDTKSSTAEAPPSSAAKTPDEAVLVVFKGLTDNQPQVVWEAMPPSYHADVNGLVADFTAKMDADIWKKGAGIAQKVVTILKTKKDFILAHPQVQGALQGGIVDKDKVAPKWDSLVAVIETLVTSDLADPAKMKSFDGGKFLATTGSSLMKQLPAISAMSPMDPVGKALSKLSSAKVTTVKTENGTATIRLEAPLSRPAKRNLFRSKRSGFPPRLPRPGRRRLRTPRKSSRSCP